MTDPHTPTPDPTDALAPPAHTRWWARLLDGGHEWGDSLVSPTRHGVTHYRLVVFPPGIDVVERRLLRAWRAWPTWGALAWVVTHIVLAALLPHGTALAVSTTAYLGGAAILFVRVTELRSRVRTLTVVRIGGHVDPHAVEMFAQWKTLTAELRLADGRRDAGHCSPVEHELTWWRVYDRLGQVRADTNP